MKNIFENRVTEGVVARILHLIATVPNQREAPAVGDLEGEYDYWFDGGACREHTGSMNFVFQDGTIATVVAPVPWLGLDIQFRDGRRVSIRQARVAPVDPPAAGAA
jgi:hypothetical protein